MRERERARARRGSHHDEVVRWVTSHSAAPLNTVHRSFTLFYFSSALPVWEREKERGARGWCRQVMASALAAGVAEIRTFSSSIFFRSFSIDLFK